MAPPASPARKPVEVESFGDIRPAFQKFLYQNPNPTTALAIEAAEKTTGVPRDQLAYGVMGLVGLYLMVGALAELVCNFIGFAYPAYASVYAIRSESKDDDTQWLTYWTTFAFFSLIDFWADRICSWFPIYWVVKVIFLIYLSAPQTRGAIKIYADYVDPLVYKIDEQISKYSTAKGK